MILFFCCFFCFCFRYFCWFLCSCCSSLLGVVVSSIADSVGAAMVLLLLFLLLFRSGGTMRGVMTCRRSAMCPGAHSSVPGLRGELGPERVLERVRLNTHCVIFRSSVIVDGGGASSTVFKTSCVRGSKQCDL